MGGLNRLFLFYFFKVIHSLQGQSYIIILYFLGKNEYFNCSSPSVEKCGVPYSCCINATDISSGLVNIMCGYGVQEHSVAAASKRIWTSGCIEIVRVWAERNLYVIAGVALGIALIQLFVIYLAKTLEGQIDLQKSRWSA